MYISGDLAWAIRIDEGSQRVLRMYIFIFPMTYEIAYSVCVRISILCDGLKRRVKLQYPSRCCYRLNRQGRELGGMIQEIRT